MGSVSLTEIIAGLIILSIQVIFIGGVVYGAIHLYKRLNKEKK